MPRRARVVAHLFRTRRPPSPARTDVRRWHGDLAPHEREAWLTDAVDPAFAALSAVGLLIRAILESLGLPANPPLVASARGPPELSWDGPAE